MAGRGAWTAVATIGLLAWVGAWPVAAEDSETRPGEVVLETESPGWAEGKLTQHVGFRVGESGLAPILRQGARCPCERRADFSTALARQTEIPLQIWRGPSRDLGDATLLGEWLVREVPAKPAGEALVHVTLRAEDGRITLLATDGESGRPLPITRSEPRAASPGR